MRARTGGDCDVASGRWVRRKTRMSLLERGISLRAQRGGLVSRRDARDVTEYRVAALLDRRAMLPAGIVFLYEP